MDRGAWQATVHGIARVRHDLATKPNQAIPENFKVTKMKISWQSKKKKNLLNSCVFP